MKNKLFSFVFILSTQILNAQTPQFEVPKLIPPSPNAYELGKYGEVPIGLFTGAINNHYQTTKV